MRIRGSDPESARILRRALLQAPLSALRDLDEWQFPMVDEECTVIAKGVGRFRIRGRTDDLFHALPGQEPAVERAVRFLLKPGDTFIDAGANIRFYTVLASQLVGPRGKVIAIEIMPETAAVLRDNIALNGASNVRVVEAALSEVSGHSATATAPPGKLGQARLGTPSVTGAVPVMTTTLKDILADVACVSLMKLDVEGMEIPAVRGAGDSLRRIRAIIFEVLGPETDATSLLESHGYRVTALDDRNRLARLEEV
ncbi:FkbM family methyltransferase [Thermosynechococcus vestitus]|nr:FkbM family methyltransferase [Thermosynechococcus vestitus]